MGFIKAQCVLTWIKSFLVLLNCVQTVLVDNIHHFLH